MADPAIEAAARAYLDEVRRPGIRKVYWQRDRGPDEHVDIDALTAAIRAYLAAQPGDRTAASMREELL